MALNSSQIKHAKLETSSVLNAKTLRERVLREQAEGLLFILAAEAVSTAKLDQRSNLIKSFEYKVKGGKSEILANDYIKWIELGRKAGSKWPPFSPLYFWTLRYRVKIPAGLTRVRFIYMLQRSIARKGILKRPFIERVVSIAELQLNPYGERLLVDINAAILDALGSKFK